MPMPGPGGLKEISLPVRFRKSEDILYMDILTGEGGDPAGKERTDGVSYGPCILMMHIISALYYKTAFTETLKM